MDSSRGTTSSTGGGTNGLNALNNCQEHINLPNVHNDMIQVFDFTVSALLDPGASLLFETKGCVYQLVRLNESSAEIAPIHSVPVVKEFLEVFLDDLP